MECGGRTKWRRRFGFWRRCTPAAPGRLIQPERCRRSQTRSATALHRNAGSPNTDYGWLCATVLSLAWMQTARVADPAIYAIGKVQIYDQASATQVSPASAGGYGFEALAVPT